MAKLKTFEEYIASMDSAEEIEKDVVAMGEPEEAEGGEEVISDDQPEAEAPEESEDEGAGEEAEEMESDAKEVHSEEDKETKEIRRIGAYKESIAVENQESSEQINECLCSLLATS